MAANATSKHITIPASNLSNSLSGDFPSLSNPNTIPSNRGYIVGSNKTYGKAPAVQKGNNVKLIDSSGNTHKWSRKAFVQGKLKHKVTDSEGWTTCSSTEFVQSRQMYPCPYELKHKGFCLVESDPEHRKYFYHYAKLPLTYNKEGRVRCRYANHCEGTKCWEAHNSEHCSVFYHAGGKNIDE